MVGCWTSCVGVQLLAPNLVVCLHCLVAANFMKRVTNDWQSRCHSRQCNVESFFEFCLLLCVCLPFQVVVDQDPLAASLVWGLLSLCELLTRPVAQSTLDFRPVAQMTELVRSLMS